MWQIINTAVSLLTLKELRDAKAKQEAEAKKRQQTELSNPVPEAYIGYEEAKEVPLPKPFEQFSGYVSISKEPAVTSSDLESWKEQLQYLNRQLYGAHCRKDETEKKRITEQIVTITNRLTPYLNAQN